MFRILDRLLAVMVCAPPVYMLYRFVKWYLKEERIPESEHGEAED